MKPDPPPLKILCVDDDPIVRIMYQMVLSRAGYACEFARDGRTALNVVKQAPAKFGLVITDIEMPVMDGWSLVQHLERIQFPGKILVISASIPGAEENNHRHFAVDQICVKPVRAPRLLEAVQELLGARTG